MKKSTLFKSLLLLCALVVGSGSSWAEDTPVYTLSFTQLDNSSPYNNYSAEHTTTCSTIEWTVQGNQAQGAYIRVGGKNTTNTDRTMTSGSALSSKAIGKVVINHSGTTNGKNCEITVNSLTVEGSTSSTFESSVKSKTISSPSVSSAGNLEFTLDEGDWDENSYFRITMNYKMTITSGSTANNCFLAVNNVKFYEASTGEETAVDIDASGISNTDVYTSTIAGKLTATVYDNNVDPIDGAVVSWSSSKKDVATVGSDGSITLVGAGTTTITASYAGKSGEYKSSQDTYNLTVTDSNPNGL